MEWNVNIALKAIKSFNLPVLVGIHLRDNGLLPSGEKINDIVKKYKNKNWLGIIMACISPKAYEAWLLMICQNWIYRMVLS